MTHEPEHLVADIVAAAGGRLVSRIRLQKIAYLLDQLGAKSGFDYVYHHYGPYSRELDAAIFDAEAFELVEERFRRRELDGARYSIFESKTPPDSPPFSCLRDNGLRELAHRLASENVTVLELAATAHWLAESEKLTDWKTEIVRRKGSKTAEGRLEEATKLLGELRLPPAVAAA